MNDYQISMTTDYCNEKIKRFAIFYFCLLLSYNEKRENFCDAFGSGFFFSSFCKIILTDLLSRPLWQGRLTCPESYIV